MSEYVPITEYYPFDPETVERVESWRERTNNDYESYHQYFYDIDHMNTKFRSPGISNETHGKKVLDIRPEEHDPETALVVHLPMANPLDPNMMFQIAAIADVCEDKRVIAFANPSGPGLKQNTLSTRERKQLVNGDISALTGAYAAYIEQQGITQTQEFGYSYGVEKALGSVTIAAAAVERVLLLEPASSKKRSLVELAKSFGKSGEALEGYVEASGMPIFEGARADSTGLLSYSLGLARLSNLAIAKTIARGNFAEHLNNALSSNLDLEATVGWGTESELSDDARLHIEVLRASLEHGMDRVNLVRLQGQKHALANHVPLQAALVYEFLVNQ